MKECTCGLSQVLRYQKRISGPLLERIDIHPLRLRLGICDIDVPRVEYDKLTGDRLGEPSSQLRERAAKRLRSEIGDPRNEVEGAEGMERARERQRERFAGRTLQCNGDMGPTEVRKYCGIDDTGRSLLRAVMPQVPRPGRDSRGGTPRDLCVGRRSSKIPRSRRGAGSARQLSARAFHRILKLARTIVADPASWAWADLGGCEQIETPHLAEALQYRPRRVA